MSHEERRECGMKIVVDFASRKTSSAMKKKMMIQMDL